MDYEFCWHKSDNPMPQTLYRRGNNLFLLRLQKEKSYLSSYFVFLFCIVKNMSDKQPIAIVGITGNQAGATAKHLLENGAHVRGIARDPSKAVEWVNSKAELVTGSMEDYDSLVKAFTGVRSVYFATPFIVDDVRKKNRAAVIPLFL